MNKRAKSGKVEFGLLDLYNDAIQYIFKFLSFRNVCSFRRVSQKANLASLRTISSTTDVMFDSSTAKVISKYCGKEVRILKIDCNFRKDSEVASIFQSALKKWKNITGLHIGLTTGFDLGKTFCSTSLPLTELWLDRHIPTLDLLKLLKSNGAQLQTLHIPTANIDWIAVAKLCPKIDRLSAGGMVLRAKRGMTIAQAYPNLSELRIMILENSDAESWRFTNLKTLHCFLVAFNTVKSFSQWNCFATLTELNLRVVLCTGEDCQDISQISRQCKQLKVLELHAEDPIVTFNFLKNCPGLVTLRGNFGSNVFADLRREFVYLRSLLEFKQDGTFGPEFLSGNGYKDLAHIAPNLKDINLCPYAKGQSNTENGQLEYNSIVSFHTGGLDLRRMVFNVTKCKLYSPDDRCVDYLCDRSVFPSLREITFCGYNKLPSVDKLRSCRRNVVVSVIS